MGGGIDETVPGFLGWLETPAGRVARISTEWSAADRLDAWKVRWAIGRTTCLVPAGLYAVGTPDPSSPVVATANYKLTWDLVRRALGGRSAWLLTLETHGINVWCAAGKGTFGTREVVGRIASTRLSERVAHRVVLLPMLAAPGVCAREVRAATGFEARFAAIRADAIPEYLDHGFRTTAAMQALTFTLRERMALVPVELVQGVRRSLPVLAACLAAGLASTRAALVPEALFPALGYLAAFLCGTVAVPLLLPWLPGRSFSLKGALAGLVPVVGIGCLSGGSAAAVLPALLALPAVSAFFALNFTGATPYTSRSGVKKELRLSLPWMGLSALAGVAAWIAGKWPG